MQKRLLMGALAASVVAPALSNATVISFHEANQSIAYYGGYNTLMYGQGAAVDPGHNVWNGFGNYPGPGSTYFYGGSNPDSAHGSVPSGDPGNPYAYYGNGTSGTSAHGSSLFVPSSNPSSTASANANSDGTISPVTLSLTFSGETGVSALNNAPSVQIQGAPNKIFSECVLVSGSTLGTFTLGSVPAGNYNLFLYGANYDGDRGAAFNITDGGGTPLGGFTSTTNPGTGGPLNSYILGGDYVEFLNVSPDAAGTIAGTFGAVTNPITNQSGEGDFNGLQLVSVAPVPEPTSIALIGLASAGLLSRRRRKA